MNLLFAHTDTVSAVPPEVNINWLAIILAVVSAMAIGYAWYGPIFGKKWMKLVGLTKKDVEGGSWQPMVFMTVLALIQAFILSHFIIYSAYFYPDLSSLLVGLITAFWAWLGFSAAAIISNNMFAMRSKDLSQIDAGYTLVNLLAMGAILGLFL
jgi:hypothetical protein